jgi:hypothetical protein
VKRRTLVTGLIAMSIVLFLSTGALAWMTRTATSNGNTISARVEKQALDKRVACAGRNERSNGNQVDFILVSWVCQLWNGSFWQDTDGSPPETHCVGCAATGWSWSAYYLPCPHFTGGTKFIRAQADGYYYNNGNQYNFAGDGVETDYVNFDINAIC